MGKVARIAGRFGTERLDISEYVRLVHSQLAVDEQEIVELNALLKRYGLKPGLPERKALLTDRSLSASELSDVAQAAERIIPAINAVMSDLNRKMQEVIPLLTRGEASDENPGLFEEWVQYAIANLPEDPRAVEYDPSEEALLTDALQRREPDEQLSEPDRRQIITDALGNTRYRKIRSIENALQFALDRLQVIRSVAKAAQPGAIAGSLRQAFILLMTAFDAALFDLVRIKLRKDFLQLVPTLGEKLKRKIQRMKPAELDARRNQLIARELGKRHLKDWLVLLNTRWKVPCVEKGARFERLIEFVLRRNIHVHKRGSVDQRYLDGDNPDGFKLGDVAVIDEQYWQLANSMLSFCLNQVARWAAS